MMLSRRTIWAAVGAMAIAIVLVIVSAAADSTPDDEDQTLEVLVDDRGFPVDWPIGSPPGSVLDCPNGEVSQDDHTFSVVLCLPDDPDPFTVSQNYLADLENDGFVEREPGAFITAQQTFLDGKGIEIYYQLVGDEATIVLIKSI